MKSQARALHCIWQRHIETHLPYGGLSTLIWQTQQLSRGSLVYLRQGGRLSLPGDKVWEVLKDTSAACTCT